MDSKLEELKRQLKSQGVTKEALMQGGQAQQAQGMNPQAQALMQSLQQKPTMGQRVGSGIKAGLDAGATMMSGGMIKPQQDDTQQKLLQTILGEQAKSLFADPLDRQVKESRIRANDSMTTQRGAGYFTQDDDGNFVPIQGDGIVPGMRPASVGYSENNQNKTKQQGRLAETQADFMQDVTGGSGVSGSNPFVVSDVSIGGIHAVDPKVTGELQQNKQDIASMAPTASQKDSLASINNVELLLDQLEKDAGTLPSGFGGMAAQGMNFITRGQSNPNLMVYDDQRKAVAVALYRALTGDTRLSDADAASRALPLLWHPNEAGQVRSLKFQKIKSLLQDRKTSLSKNFGGTEEGQSGQPSAGGQTDDAEYQEYLKMVGQ